MEPNLKLAPVDPAANATDTSKAKDLVCGMAVNQATAKHTLQHAGTHYYFCSAGCATKFKGDPEKYLDQPAKSSASHMMLGAAAKPVMISPAPQPSSTTSSAGYVCPMCP